MAYIPSTGTNIPIIATFNETYVTTISYPPAVKAILGAYPTVQVAYWDRLAHEYVINNDPSSRVEFRGDYIQIFHGGSETGIVKVF